MITRTYDCVILGSGLAGIYTALNLDARLKIAILSKSEINQGSSNMAQGGIACEIEGSASKLQEHYEDTLKAGCYLNHKVHTRILIEEAAMNFKKLLSFGVSFDKDLDGSFIKTLEGAHRSKRILHAGGDATGSNVMQDLYKVIRSRSNITFYENEMGVELQVVDNKVQGILCVDRKNNYILYQTPTVIISTGGVGGVYPHTTNESFALGDGIALARRAGIQISNMEFIQFHPTGLYERDQKGKCFLISEAVRGEGGVLRNQKGVRFMEDYDPIQMELAPRDVVARAIYKEMKKEQSSFVYLDITHKSKEELMNRFPTIYKKCLSIGIDMSKDYIPVTPVEHFLCGGIETNSFGQSSLDGVYAVGECANTGVHGANRLASNSLLECLVFGARVAQNINQLPKIKPMELSIKPPKFENDDSLFEVQDELRTLMEESASIIRSQDSLESARKKLETYQIKGTSFTSYEVLNQWLTSRLIIEASIQRKESMGCHTIEEKE